MKIIPWKFCIVDPNNSNNPILVKFVFFLKIRLLFKVFYCFCMFVNKHFPNSTSKQLDNSND